MLIWLGLFVRIYLVPCTITSTICEEYIERKECHYPCRWEDNQLCRNIEELGTKIGNSDLNVDGIEDCTEFSFNECNDDKNCIWDEFEFKCNVDNVFVEQRKEIKYQIQNFVMIRIECTKISRDKCDQTPGCYWNNLRYNCLKDDDYFYIEKKELQGHAYENLLIDSKISETLQTSLKLLEGR